jgi:hypothetical protein
MTSIFSFGKIPSLDNKEIAVQILQRVLWEKMAQSYNIAIQWGSKKILLYSTSSQIWLSPLMDRQSTYFKNLKNKTLLITLINEF